MFGSLPFVRLKGQYRDLTALTVLDCRLPLSLFLIPEIKARSPAWTERDPGLDLGRGARATSGDMLDPRPAVSPQCGGAGSSRYRRCRPSRWSEGEERWNVAWRPTSVHSVVPLISSALELVRCHAQAVKWSRLCCRTPLLSAWVRHQPPQVTCWICGLLMGRVSPFLFNNLLMLVFRSRLGLWFWLRGDALQSLP